MNVSHRNSKRNDTSSLFGPNSAATTGSGEETTHNVTIAEGSWVIGQRSFATAKYTRFENETLGTPDFLSPATASPLIGSKLDISNLITQGRLNVPTPVAGAAAYNAFIQPFIDKYGYVNAAGVRTGGGFNGYATQLNDQDFFRDQFQVGYNLTLGASTIHELHFGYQWYEDSSSCCAAPTAGAKSPSPAPALAAGRQRRADLLHGEVSAAIGRRGGTDRVQCTGRRTSSSTTRFAGTAGPSTSARSSATTRCLDRACARTRVNCRATSLRRGTNTRCTTSWKKMIQPRLSVVRSYNGADTIFASYARYNPAASSLPRAASWDRNLTGTFIDAHFDANGVLFAAVPVGSSSGKLFVQDMTPRSADEYMIGTSIQMSSNLTSRIYGRYREGKHSGKTPTTTRARPSTRRPEFRVSCTSRT